MGDVETELLDYEEEEPTAAEGGEAGGANGAAAANGANGANGAGAAAGAKKDGVKGTYVSIHSSGFRDFLLKPEILRAIVDLSLIHI